MQRRIALLLFTGLLAIGFSVGAAIVILDGDEAGSQDADATSSRGIDGPNLFRAKGCVGCHIGPGVDEGTGIGPSLTNLPDVAENRVEGMSAREYVRTSIVAPDDFVVPGYAEGMMPRLQLTTDEVESLVSYLLGDS
ncbi:MAG: c-type cytochrome [Chloroflexota bacterium]